ncbi:DUF805 domain-containing protein [Kiloniella sp. EL199]|uniref:DUF805 domain-containing protein n=1 Tax=Kiloniella sp. EL199 TaxID=2107581 RepID=UPI00352FD72F
MVDKNKKYTRTQFITQICKLLAISVSMALVIHLAGQLDTKLNDYLIFFIGLAITIFVFVPLILCISILPLLYIGYRLNDIGTSHWIGLICIIPPVIIVAIIILCLIPSRNQHVQTLEQN